MNHLQQVIFCQWVSLALRVIGLAVLIYLAAVGLGRAHIAGHAEWDEWMAAQVTPDGLGYSCCNKSDAYLLDDDAVRIVNGEYEGFLEGQWVRFPNAGPGKPGNTVLATMGNPTGHAVAWWTAAHGPYCFAEGTMT